MGKISVGIPTRDLRWHWTQCTVGTAESVPEVSEVVVIDDASPDCVRKLLREKTANYSKVKFMENLNRLFPFANKYRVVENCKEDWVALLDSDNAFDGSYFSAFLKDMDSHDRNVDILCPSFARPNFNYLAYSGKTICAENIGQYFDNPMFFTLLNTGNFVVRKSKYLSSLKGVTGSPIASDVIFAIYHLLTNGARIYVVPGMEYQHNIHEGSVYKEYVNQEPGKTKEVENLIRSLGRV